TKLVAEILVLRQQLNVLRRQVSKRPQLSNTDRFLFVWLYRWFPSVLSAIAILRPELGQSRVIQTSRARSPPRSRRRGGAPQGDAELMAKEQVLDFKSPRRLQEVDDEHCERMQEREHRRRSCADSTRRCDSQAGWNFRKAHRIEFTMRRLPS